MEEIKAWLKKMIDRFLDDLLPDSMRKRVTTPTPSVTSTPTTPSPVQSAPAPSNVEHHKVAGISYRTEELLTLGTENPDYSLTKKQLIEEGLTDERIYRTDFYPDTCELVPEPDNPEDPKAIKVVVDGAHIGYIKQGSCAHIHKLLREDRIEGIDCEISGGPYKVVLTDYNEDGGEVYSMEKDTAPYYAVVVVRVKKDEEPA